jgi:hypothetical protein
MSEQQQRQVLYAKCTIRFYSWIIHVLLHGRQKGYVRLVVT